MGANPKAGKRERDNEEEDVCVLYNTYERARRFPHHYYIRDVMIKRKKREYWDKRDNHIIYNKTVRDYPQQPYLLFWTKN